MERLLNKIFYFLKFILWVASFVLCLYVIMFMYQRLHKSITEAISVFLPFVLLFILFAINMIMNQKPVKNNIFYNITCCIVFLFLVYAGYRAITDKYMIANEKLGYGINFNYYADTVAPMKVMLYGLCISNVCLMFSKVKKEESKKDEKKIEEQKENKTFSMKKTEVKE